MWMVVLTPQHLEQPSLSLVLSLNISLFTPTARASLKRAGDGLRDEKPQRLNRAQQ
jgi:hypothetical protein